MSDRNALIIGLAWCGLIAWVWVRHLLSERNRTPLHAEPDTPIINRVLLAVTRAETLTDEEWNLELRRCERDIRLELALESDRQQSLVFNQIGGPQLELPLVPEPLPVRKPEHLLGCSRVARSDGWCDCGMVVPHVRFATGA